MTNEGKIRIEMVISAKMMPALMILAQITQRDTVAQLEREKAERGREIEKRKKKMMKIKP
jgi:translation initiation factor 2B subunit (eIF-2B alpha/beta/delta family)